MKAAGVTVGGFYKHFDWRDELVLSFDEWISEELSTDSTMPPFSP
jgi:hypothetical protein